MCSAIGGTVAAVIMMLATAPIANWAISALWPARDLRIGVFRSRGRGNRGC